MSVDPTVEHTGQAALRKAMHDLLRGGTVVVLATVSPEDVVSTALCSWIVAKGSHRLALALDMRSSAYTSIAAGSDRVALEVMGDEILLSIRGKATIEQETLDSVPFPCALACVDVDEIRDHMIEGLQFHGPRHKYSSGKEYRADVERKIFEELERA